MAAPHRREWLTQSFKDETYLWYIRTLEYRAVNTLHLGYKNQSFKCCVNCPIHGQTVFAAQAVEQNI
jgi:hypothetical protein